MRRKLAAVLAADVAGYSGLMEADADGTLEALLRMRAEVLRPTVAARRGRVVKSMGDGWLVVFDGATDAVECAMQIQDRLADNARIRLRIGVHLGDVVEAEEDIFGSAVNIASRLQELAQPGAVAISDAVFLTLDGALRPSFDDAGERWLKNIARPLRVLVRGGEIAGGAERRAPAGFPRLVVVPVATSSERPELRELAQGLSGDLLARLGGTQWLRARIALHPEPGAYVLAATLRARGDDFRLETTLTTPDGAHLWFDKRDGTVADLFHWQDDAVASIATLGFRRLLAHAVSGLDRARAAPLTAEQWALLALARGGADGESHRKALDCLAEAIRLAPDWGYVHALALAILMGAVSLGLAAYVEPYLEKQAEWVARVEALEPPVSPARITLAFARLVRTKDPLSVRADVRTQLRGLPFEPDVLIWAGYIHLYMGEPEAALDCFERFNRCVVLDAYVPAVRAGAAGALLQLGRYEECLAKADEAIRINPLYPSPLRIRAAACGHLGRQEEARAALAALDRLSPSETIAAFSARSGYCDTPVTRHYFEGLRLAGMPTGA